MVRPFRPKIIHVDDDTVEVSPMPFGGEAFQAPKQSPWDTDFNEMSPMPFGGEAFQATPRKARASPTRSACLQCLSAVRPFRPKPKDWEPLAIVASPMPFGGEAFQARDAGLLGARPARDVSNAFRR